MVKIPVNQEVNKLFKKLKFPKTYLNYALLYWESFWCFS